MGIGVFGMSAAGTGAQGGGKMEDLKISQPSGVTIKVTRHYGNPRWCPHWDECEGPCEAMAFDDLMALVRELQSYGNSPIRYSPEALELLRQDVEAQRDGKASPLYPDWTPERDQVWRELAEKVGPVEAIMQMCFWKN
jgi:hypothetical protein